MSRPIIVNLLAWAYIAAAIYYLAVFGFLYFIASKVGEIGDPSQTTELVAAPLKPLLALLGAVALLRGESQGWWLAALFPLYLLAPRLETMVRKPYLASLYGPPRQGFLAFYARQITFSLLFALPFLVLLSRGARQHFGLKAPRILLVARLILLTAGVLAFQLGLRVLMTTRSCS